MSKNNSCYWSKSRNCNRISFKEIKDIFIIGSCDEDREEYIDIIKKIIQEIGLYPIFAEDLKENNNLDAFCDNICSHIISSRLIINDISAPIREICKKCGTTDFFPSLNVYWEYGYAAGLGKPQIVICDQEQINKIPFDVAGKQIQPYTKETLEEILKPLIENELKNPIPKSRFQVYYSDSERKEISAQEVENIKQELRTSISQNDLKLIFTFFPKFEEPNLFPLDNEMIEFLKLNLPRRVDKKYPVFRGFSNFALKPTYISYISDYIWFGNNIIINSDGIIGYGIYVNGDKALIYGKIKMFPFHEILNCFLAILGYIQRIFEKEQYDDNINLSMDIENISTYRYTVGNLETSAAIYNENIGKFNGNGIRPIKREINLLELKNPNYKIKISKFFFNSILRGFGKTDSDKYEEFLKKMQD